ncbi:valine--tRNA ligase [Candidatus Parcubacteria bacterium]|uniref:Valine--tRNA ligase n=1 Tax=Candidatus Kaiserbacteria bacterium CG10_big_fil_rev_8_21_14_0_10_47_16 TaxID=1974608 RepID=A0A2H0UCY1_9BACT|nr:valine--tRNA ligase [Candidatus Parcubacteria bacterium]PIR84284.1 MAG: valine--tRNA ligase [Candidatus Kaiserbacteria bacterium CG10_big_fil_rev_8_21_14_0_10_47_16]
MEEKSSQLPEIFLKPYDAQAHEKKCYEMWESSGLFNPDVSVEKGITQKDAETFSMVLPPPNVTGHLHMGSALMLAIEDMMVRHARMQGKRTLWIPGTDSAAIATQARVEKDIQKEEKKTRHDLGREELLKRIDAFVEKNKSHMIGQMRAMGASLDWSRYAYTMDDARYDAVMEAFIQMHAAGLIYRGNRIVNWDPKGQTTISDDEIVYEERKATLYTFKYSKDFPIPVSTTRLETKVGDVAVAVHPDDARYKEFVGKEYDVMFCDVPLHITIVADTEVDPEFGTGALGVTPAHSHVDWEIADRHGITNRPAVINEYAKMTVAGHLEGMKVNEAREAVAEWLRAEDLLEKEEEITQNVSTAERTGGIVEPLPKLQWWIDVDKTFTLPHSEIPGIESGSETTLKEIMRSAVKSGTIQFVSERHERVYMNWIDNLRPWCISRQIWFGHRIPVWHKDEEMKVQVESPGESWEQDPDVLDTWFSSGLWTFSTLGWPNETDDLKTYHPTTLIESGYDILFFWIARMVLMSGFFLGQVPFKTVYLHGLVRDGQGRKISKSLGNNIDPIDMIEKYGTDAVRLSLVTNMVPGSDSRISEDKIRGYKHFANKIWNISRFVLENRTVDTAKETQWDDADKRDLAELDATITDVNGHMESHRIDLAVDAVYHYVWHTFADEVIERSKDALKGDDVSARIRTSRKLQHILTTSLKLLHPFMPFVTEAVWQELPKDMKDAELLMVAKWPRT